MIYSLDDLLVDTGRQSVSRNAESIALPKLSFDLLIALIRSAPNVVSMDELMQQVWPGLVVSPETVSQRVKLLRDALGDDSRAPRYIASLRGRGYQLVAVAAQVIATPSVIPTPIAVEQLNPISIAEPLRESSDGPDSRKRPIERKKFALIGIAIIAAVIGTWQYRAIRVPTKASVSIAVMPFDNTSRDVDAVDFANGVHDEIRTELEKIGSLKVISQNSTDLYSSSPPDLSVVAKQLNVGHVLEGSVDKNGDRVRIHVQLFEANGGLKIWEESYDRRADDIAGIKRNVAQAIASTLRASLTNNEKHALAGKSDRNSEAYNDYLRALAISHRRDASQADMVKITKLLENAVRLDSTFANAWALLAQENAHRYLNHIDKPTTRVAARGALETALRLQPEQPETLVAEGYYFYWVEADYDAATRVLLQVRAKWPNVVDARVALARIARRQQRNVDSAQYFEEAIELDPRNMEVIMGAGYERLLSNQIPAALKWANYALDVLPDDVQALGFKASIYQSMGNLDEADAVLGRLPQRPGDLATAELLAEEARLRRRFPEAIGILQNYLSKPDAASDPELLKVRRCLGHVMLLNRDRSGATRILSEVRKELQDQQFQMPDAPTIIGPLALVTADLGEAELARKLADSVFKLESVTKDMNRVLVNENIRAKVAARIGDEERAIASLKVLLQSSFLKPGLLRIDPDWDSLRDSPEFQQLVAEPPSDATRT